MQRNAQLADLPQGYAYLCPVNKLTGMFELSEPFQDLCTLRLAESARATHQNQDVMDLAWAKGGCGMTLIDAQLAQKAPQA